MRTNKYLGPTGLTELINLIQADFQSFGRISPGLPLRLMKSVVSESSRSLTMSPEWYSITPR